MTYSDPQPISKLGLPYLELEDMENEDGTYNTAVFVCEPIQLKIAPLHGQVGVVPGHELFGRVIFTSAFVDKYPVLKQVIVLCIPDEEDEYEEEGVLVYVRPLPEFGPETSKLFGATLLLAHIAQDVGLSTALAQAAPERDAANIFMAANAMVQARTIDLDKIAALGQSTILGDSQLTLPALEELSPRLEQGPLPDNFNQAMLKLKLAADRAQGHFSNLVWGQLQYDFASAITVLFDQNSGLPLCFKRNADEISPLLSAALSSKTAPAHSQDTQSDAAAMSPWPLTYIVPQNMRNAVWVNDLRANGREVSYRLERDDPLFDKALRYALKQGLSSAPELQIYDQKFRYLELPKRMCPPGIKLFAFFDRNQFRARIKNTIKIAKYVLDAHTYDSFRYIDPACRQIQKQFRLTLRDKEPYDELCNEQWHLNRAGCRRYLQTSISWIQATSRTDFDARQALLSWYHFEAISKFNINQRITRYDEEGQPIMSEHSCLFIENCAAALYQALRQRADAALHGEFGRMPTEQETAILSDPWKLILFANDLETKFDGNSIVPTRLSSEAQSLFAVLGIPLDQVPSAGLTWRHWLNLGK